MALLSVLLSLLYLLLLLLIPPILFLWIIGKLKEIRLQRQLHEQKFLQPSTIHPEPSPTNIPLEPRRLSFSSATTPNTPTPTANPKRRVTFSLTPEQQANELLKTAVRRRESLPSANLLVPHQSPPTQYNLQPQPEQVAHLFPPRNASNFRFNPHPARAVFPPFHQHPVHVPQPEQPRLKPSNPSSLALQKRKTSPNKNQTSLPKRQRNPSKAASRPLSAPVYAADLRREPEQSKKYDLEIRAPHLKRSHSHEEEKPNPKLGVDKSSSTTNGSLAQGRVLNDLVRQEPGQKRRRTPPSDKKPPKSPGLGALSNGFAPQPRLRFPQDGDKAIRQNGVMLRPIR